MHSAKSLLPKYMNWLIFTTATISTVSVMILSNLPESQREILTTSPLQNTLFQATGTLVKYIKDLFLALLKKKIWTLLMHFLQHIIPLSATKLRISTAAFITMHRRIYLMRIWTGELNKSEQLHLLNIGSQIYLTASITTQYLSKPPHAAYSQRAATFYTISAADKTTSLYY